MTIDWHYPRKDLTENVLVAYETGLSNTLTLFAPRRMGKTEFVLYDLIPAAVERGYVPVYVSFWDNKDDPAVALMNALKTTLNESTWWRRATQGLTAGKISMKASATGGIEGAVEAGFKEPKALDSDTLIALRAVFHSLINKHDRILLCLDEVQHLATKPAFENLIFFLRTILDENRKSVRVIYTGSSRDDLRKLFSKRKAALFQSSSQLELPELGAAFVEHMRHCYMQASGREFSMRDGMAAFHSLNHVPSQFRSVLEIMTLSGHSDIMSTAALERDNQIEDSNYPEIWRSLKSIDQAILSWIARGGDSLYQDPCKEFVARHLGIDSPQVQTHTIQNSVNRLRRHYLSLLSHGSYDFEDANFRDWIQMNVEQPELD